MNIQVAQQLIPVIKIIKKMQQQPQQPHPQSQSQTDLQTYEHILQKQQVELVQIKPITATTALLTQILFKGIVIALFYFDEIFNELISKMLTSELTLVFVIVDFWFTKNVNGRRLLGITWFFGEDQFGNQRFKFQVRINQEYVSPVNSKVFWIMQFAYLVVPIVDLSTTIIIAPNLYRVSWQKVFINVCVIFGAISNTFLFYVASSAAMEKLNVLRQKFSHEFIRKLGPNSLISYL